MRWGTCLIIVFALLSGCAAQKKPTVAERPVMVERYQPAAAGSLVFDPPVTLGQPALELSRDLRSPDAFVAYESQTTTYFYLRIDDRQTSDRSDRYERRAVSTKVGVSYR